ncbi:hypothetical protein ES708_23114 [subsurface metagenome]
MKHKHRFVAIPITGQNAWDGKEGLFGYRFECEHCGKFAKEGDTIEEVKQSWLKEIMPESKLVNYVVPAS